jgi:hypothetical protein
MRLSLELKALTTHPRRCRSDVTVAKIMARILSKYAVSSCLQVIHSADARSFDEGQRYLSFTSRDSCGESLVFRYLHYPLLWTRGHRFLAEAMTNSCCLKPQSARSWTQPLGMCVRSQTVRHPSEQK